MKFEIRRVILFTSNMDVMSRFYGEVIGLELAGEEDGWRDFKAGACNIALHQGWSTVGKRPHKIVFYADDVAAARVALIRRGAKAMGKIISTETFDMFNGKDPDGNPFQISGRK